MSQLTVYIGSDNLETHLNEQENIVLGHWIIVASDANNLSDGITGLGRGYHYTDSLNAWNDAAAVDFLVFALNQTINISDRIDKPKGNSHNTTFPAMVDGLNFAMDPDGPLEIQTNDLSTFSDDRVVLGIGLILSDANSLSDALFNVAVGIRKEAFDSMFFHIFDDTSIFNIGLQTQTASSSLNSWSDAAAAQLFSALNPGDTLNLADLAELLLRGINNSSDTLLISDGTALLLAHLLSISDDLNNLSDAAVVATTIKLTISESDTLSMSDALSSNSPLLSTALTGYLRRYLNDVVN